MKRSSSLLIGLLAAAVTFGSLMAFVGPKNFGNRGYYGDRRYHCDWQDNRNNKNTEENTKTKNSNEDSSKQNK